MTVTVAESEVAAVPLRGCPVSGAPGSEKSAPGPPASTTNDSEGKTNMKYIATSRKRCPECRTRLLRVEGQLACPTLSCPASPLATLESARQLHPPPSVPAGYRPADHSLPPANGMPGWYGNRAVKAAARTPETHDDTKREEPLRGALINGVWINLPQGL